MKRFYYNNQEVQIEDFTLRVTFNGKVYLVSNGSFRNIDHVLTKTGILVKLPNGKDALIYFDKEDKTVKAKLVHEVIDPIVENQEAVSGD